jgi:asparagine synthase (glutamine-hydrolysing)
MDHRLVKFSSRLPLKWKLSEGQGKPLLRKLLSRYLPEEIVRQKKEGFSIPISKWLRGPLRDWAESQLAKKRIREDSPFKVKPVRRAWEKLLDGHNGYQTRIWTILMFQQWYYERI